MLSCTDRYSMVRCVPYVEMCVRCVLYHKVWCGVLSCTVWYSMVGCVPYVETCVKCVLYHKVWSVVMY